MHSKIAFLAVAMLSLVSALVPLPRGLAESEDYQITCCKNAWICCWDDKTDLTAAPHKKYDGTIEKRGEEDPECIGCDWILYDTNTNTEVEKREDEDPECIGCDWILYKTEEESAK